MATLTTTGVSDMLHWESIFWNVNQIKKSIDKVDVECLPLFSSSAVSFLWRAVQRAGDACFCVAFGTTLAAVTLIILLDLEAIGRIEQLDNISEVTDDIPPRATVTEASNLLELFNQVGKYHAWVAARVLMNCVLHNSWILKQKALGIHH